jgi:acyl transferase domain-containing protein
MVPLTVGATKANAGHSEAASGQVGLLKVRRVLRDAAAFGNPHLRVLNPLVSERLGVVSSCVSLPMHACVNSGLAAAGLSAFGYSGTITHVVLDREISTPKPFVRGADAWVHARAAFPWETPRATVGRESKSDAMCVPFLGALGRQSSSELQWEQQLVGHELTFLQCHRVGKVPLLPGTCYIEMARNMAVAIHGGCAFTLARATFENIMFLDDTDLDGGPSVRLHLDRTNALVTISSRRETTAWSSHANLALELRDAAATVSIDVASVIAHSSEQTTAGALYAAIANDYRGEFRAMAAAWGGSGSDVLGRISYSSSARVDVHLRTCAWLDACTHALIWFSRQQRCSSYVAAVSAYHMDSMDVSSNREMWGLMTTRGQLVPRVCATVRWRALSALKARVVARLTAASWRIAAHGGISTSCGGSECRAQLNRARSHWFLDSLGAPVRARQCQYHA